MTDTNLSRRPSTLTTWGKWRNKYPETDVLTPATGHVRDYSKDPYADYYESRSGLFGFLKGGPDAEGKELVVGINVGNIAKTYKLKEIQSAGQINDKIEKTEITLKIDVETERLTVKDKTGKTLDQMILYWFVWKELYPESEVYTK